MIKRFIFFIVFILVTKTLFAQNTAEEHQQRLLFIPNAFTPNGDGINDVFKIVNLEQEELIQFKVFNKWGTVLYESSTRDAYWDGTYKGKLQETGEYGYVIQIKYPYSNKIKEYRGTISLFLE